MIAYQGGFILNDHIDHHELNSSNILVINTWAPHYETMHGCYAIKGVGLVGWVYFLFNGNIGDRYKSWKEFNAGHRVHGMVEDEDFVVNDEKKANALAQRKFYNIVAVGRFW